MDKEVREKKFLLAQSHSIRTRNKKRKKTHSHKCCKIIKRKKNKYFQNVTTYMKLYDKDLRWRFKIEHLTMQILF